VVARSLTISAPTAWSSASSPSPPRPRPRSASTAPSEGDPLSSRLGAPPARVLATVVWFPLVGWADVAIVATGTWRWLEPLGAAMLLGVLAQAITASLGYLAPQLRPLGPARDAVRERAEARILERAFVWNAGVALVVAAAVAGPAAGGAWGWVAKTGWTLVLATALVQIVLVASAWRTPRH